MDWPRTREPDRIDPAGKLRFICVPGNVYRQSPEGALALAEQALSDFAWLSLRDGVNPQSLAIFRNLHTLSRLRLDQILRRYPENVQDSACRIMHVGYRCKADRR